MGLPTSNCSDLLSAKYPGLAAVMWTATRSANETVRLAPLQQAANDDGGENERRANNMTGFFHELGAKGRSPVAFQIQRASAGKLDYSRRDPLVDYLLCAEVASGYLIGFHDREAVGEDLVFGLAKEASGLVYEHISRKTVELRPDEPVLIARDRIVASLRHGPDYATRVTPSTTHLWAVLFAAPADDRRDAELLARRIADGGSELDIWTLDQGKAEP
jgi:DNA/RNA-binding domain of Phe-tRNA-synthetase-like protein